MQQGLNIPLLQGSGLPSMLQSRLAAPRILPAHKAADYVLSKLREQGQLCVMPDLWHDANRRRPSVVNLVRLLV